MYVRTISRKNKDGSTVEYVQLANNVWDPKRKYAKAEVIYSFGRRDQLELEAIRRLVKSLCRFLSPEDVVQVEAVMSGRGQALRFVDSRPMGGAYVLRELWKRLHLHEAIEKAISDRAFVAPVEMGLFAMVANRALAPSSKLAVEQWVREEVYLGNGQPLEVQHLYRAMDVLLEHQEVIEREVFFSSADLLNLQVDLIFFDTTSTYFEVEEEDDFRLFGYSRDKRGDLPQVVIGLAVTKEGIPIRSWAFPGNEADVNTVTRVQKDLAGWKLGRVVWVMDRGMSSEQNRVVLQRAGGHYILGEKLRDNKELNQMALGKPGRYRQLADNLQVKEVVIGRGLGRRRFVICYNPQEAQRDKERRERLIRKLEEQLQALGDLKGKTHTKAVCTLRAHPSMGRYIKELPGGRLKVDRAKLRAEEKLDGRSLLSCSDESLTAEEIALGYKQLFEVERAFRTLKSTLELRPIYHRREDRIRSHVLLCWLALLLVRIIEVETGQSWDRLCKVLQQMHLGEFISKDGRVFQRTELTHEQSNLLKTLKIPNPKLVLKADLNP
jgi:transposase